VKNGEEWQKLAESGEELQFFLVLYRINFSEDHFSFVTFLTTSWQFLTIPLIFNISVEGLTISLIFIFAALHP
jgi:hypothetical protein